MTGSDTADRSLSRALFRSQARVHITTERSGAARNQNVVRKHQVTSQDPLHEVYTGKESGRGVT